MTREEAKQLLPIIKAYSEGKEIQIRINKDWVSRDTLSFNTKPQRYRIKPEPKYRPFKNAEECWNEMQNHQPFGWLKDKEEGRSVHIGCVTNNYGCSLNGNYGWYFEDIINHYSFVDGSEFGKLEEN